jgi:SAM-dependent methyltransferase
MAINIREHNRAAWDALVDRGNRWTIPTSAQAIDAARYGKWGIFLTPTKAVPKSWFGELAQQRVLCLASGGGQQAPILAAAGAIVTVLDNSPKQLEQDARLAEQHGLAIETLLGDMADLSVFRDETYDIVVNPVSSCFVPDVHPVWAGTFRVLRPGGCLLSGFNNPIVYMFDQQTAAETGRLEVTHRLPYSDVEALDANAIEALRLVGVPLEFSHTLRDLIGGQLAAGFVLTALYEDSDHPGDGNPLNKYTSTYIATRALKPSR